ncbi:MAG: hypothetical protein NVS2B5_02080 [Beijerinckiaceae bacterium]
MSGVRSGVNFAAMTPTGQNPALEGLTASEAQRLLPRVGAGASRLRFGGLLALFLFIHVSVIGILLYRDSWNAADITDEQEIPVEVVSEPPPEPKPVETAEQPRPDFDKPAMSAPRAPSETAIDETGLQQKTDAAQTQSTPQDGRPAPASDAVATSQTAAAQGATEEKISADEKAEPLDTASPMPDPTAGQAATRAKADATAGNTILQQLAAPPTLSNFSFASTTKLAPLTGGTEDNRFMANVFAKIMSKKRYPRSAVARHASGFVMVSFIIDGSGGLVFQTLTRSSGEADLDAEAMAAVKSAAPYPAPPPGAPHSLMATIKF